MIDFDFDLQIKKILETYLDKNITNAIFKPSPSSSSFLSFSSSPSLDFRQTMVINSTNSAKSISPISSLLILYDL